MIYFFDTNCFINNLDYLSAIINDQDKKIMLANKTIEELENIKVSANKDDEVKFQARQAIRWIDSNADKVGIVQQNYNKLCFEISNIGLEVTPDNIIIASAWVTSNNCPEEELLFITNDILCKQIARSFFNLNTACIVDDSYTGFKQLTEDVDIKLFHETQDNIFNLIKNQYVIINQQAWVWCNNEYTDVHPKTIKSNIIGDIEPKDIYQACAIHSMENNKITLLRGKAGTGKSLLALGYLFELLEKRKIDRIIIFCNMPKVKGTKSLGYYSGDKNKKILQDQIGNFLESKLGSIEEVENLMGLQKNCRGGVLTVLPMSDLRGFDTTGMNAGVYITEAQNTTKDIMKLCLQRIGEDSKVIIDGDDDAQVDDVLYEGDKNGIKRLSQVFRGEDIYGEVTLQNVYRSVIAKIADLM